MQVKQLDHVNLSVKDFDRTVDWYKRIFGFELVEEEVEEGVRWGIIRSGDAMLCIYEHPHREFEDRFGLAKRNLHGVAHYAFRITDEAAWKEIMARENVVVNYGGVVDWPNSKSWYVSDPTGYEIEVVKWNDDTIQFN